MNETIFFVEDDVTIHSLIKATLNLNGYNVTGFTDPKDFIAQLEQTIPDLLILDLMLPNMSGYEVIEYMKNNDKYKNIPIIIVSALSDELDVVTGLDNGAVDYISKPFGVLEFMSRVRSALRNTKSHKEENTIIGVRRLIIDKKKFICTLNGKPLPLTAKEYQLLTVLIENKGKVLSRSELLQLVWGYEGGVETRTLDMHIKTIREKMSHITSEQYITTVRSIGYVIYEDEE